MPLHRVEKMASNVKAIISDVILNELNDPRISPLTSVTRVEMSRDLQIAKTFISVLGSDAECRRTFAGLKHAIGHVQRILAHRLATRHCPEIRLYVDDSLKQSAKTVEMINEVMIETPPPAANDDGKPQENHP